MLWVIVLFAVGLVLTIKGGDYFVDAASWLAEVTGIPKIVVGATIVSLATTLPELLVSVMAVSRGSVDMGVGNAVGSVTCNLGLILGISLVWLPGKVQRKELIFKGLLMMGAGLVLWLMCWNGRLLPWQGVLLMAILAVFVLHNVRHATSGSRAIRQGREHLRATRMQILVNASKFFLGAAGILLGARLLVDNGSAIARALGVPESIIGLTLVALGTSLPELVTTIAALVKKQSDMSVGNILGANIIDLTLILGVCAFVAPEGLPIAQQTLRLDLPVCLVLMAIAVLPAFRGNHFRRWQGLSLLAGYGTYLVLLMLTL